MDMGHDRCLVTLSFIAIKIINKIYEEISKCLERMRDPITNKLFQIQGAAVIED